MHFAQFADPAIYATTVDDLPDTLRGKTTVVQDRAALNRKIAGELADALDAKTAAGEMLTVICPAGPIDYAYCAEEIVRRGLSCENLRTLNMDEYVDPATGSLIDTAHPLSFRRFMDERFFSRLPEDKRPRPENVLFPDPRAPEHTTELIDALGGADLCWTGFGITGHIAFNDP
ncbi:MAG: hypothetical protein JW951_07620, partial [Lentisphaerae bacterium]|nr:hypothetical protein [Lentisphaerota bacterium]